MQMMTAAVLNAAPGGLQIEQLPVPEPRANEVLVKVHACGVCHTDLHVMKAEVAFPTPAVMGHEISGTVVALGPGVKGPAVGTRVVSAFVMPCGFCPACGAGRDDLCDNFFGMNRLKGTLFDGTTRLRRADGSPVAMYSMAGMAEYSVVPATDVFPLPEGLPLEESAVLGCAVFTGYGAVRHAAELRGGERIAVVATGGVGLTIVQIAKAFGASQIIAVDVRDDKLEAARKLGATDVVNSAKLDAVKTIREMTGGVGVDVAFEVLGPARDVRAGVRKHPRRRPHGGRRHRGGQERRADRNHAPGAPRPPDRRLLRRADALGHAGNHPPGRAGRVPPCGHGDAPVQADRGGRGVSIARARRDTGPRNSRSLTLPALRPWALDLWAVWALALQS